MNETESELFIEQIEIGPMQNFVYLVGSRTTREVAMVDPAWDIDELLERVDKLDLSLVAALVTHYHQDHVGGEMMGRDIQGLAELIAARDVKTYVNKHEADGLRKVTGLSESDLVKVDSGDRLRIGEVEVEFLHTPGHTPRLAVVFVFTTPWCPVTRCSFRAAAGWICQAQTPTRCSQA